MIFKILYQANRISSGAADSSFVSSRQIQSIQKALVFSKELISALFNGELANVVFMIYSVM